VQCFLNGEETNPIGLFGCYGLAEWAKAKNFGIEKAKQYSLHFFCPFGFWATKSQPGVRIEQLGCVGCMS
jgi:hypothetical protein